MAQDLQTGARALANQEPTTNDAGKPVNGAEKRTANGGKVGPPPAYSSSGIELDVLYTPASISNLDPTDDIGAPGRYPFTRGVQPTMYRGRLWTMRQYSGFGTPKESNQRYKWLLEQGQTGISVALDLPTQLGLDSDDPEAIDDVGRVGVAIDTLADMETLFDGIPLDRVSTSFKQDRRTKRYRYVLRLAL